MGDKIGQQRPLTILGDQTDLARSLWISRHFPQKNPILACFEPDVKSADPWTQIYGTRSGIKLLNLTPKRS